MSTTRNEANSAEYLKMISEQLIRDYYTAGFKAEVTIDTLISPVITDLLKELDEKEKWFCENISFITKEFPLVIGENSNDNRNTKADFILQDREYFYLVEMKTSNGNEVETQLERYAEKLKEGSPEELMEFFDKLVRNYYPKQIKENGKSRKAENMKDLFSEMQSDSDSYTDYAKDSLHKYYIGKGKKEASKKYLMQSAQILEAYGKSGTGKGKKLRMIYLIPDETQDKIINEIFQKKGIREEQYRIYHFKDLAWDKKESESYYTWVKKSILEPLFRKGEER